MSVNGKKVALSESSTRTIAGGGGGGGVQIIYNGLENSNWNKSRCIMAGKNVHRGI